MLDPFLEHGGGIADDAVEVLERRVPVVVLARLRGPEAGRSEEVSVARHAAREREPLQVVGREDVVLERKVDAGMRGGRRHDRRKMRRELLRDGPLVEAGVGAAPHRDLAVAPGLLRQPLDDVVSVAAVVGEGFEDAAGVPAAAHVHEREHVAVRGEVESALEIAVADVRREREDSREIFLLAGRPVDRRVQRDAVAHRNLHGPLHLDLRAVRRLVGRKRGRRECQKRRRRDRRTQSIHRESSFGSSRHAIAAPGGR